MKKFLNSLFIVLIIIGIAGAGATYSDAIIAIKGNVVSLNEATADDFKEPAIIEGDIYYVYDCIATEEVTNTKYGIKTGTTETNFYLIESYEKSWFTDENDSYTPLTLIYATADKEEIKKLDSMVDAWYDYEEAAYAAETQEEFDAVELPSNTFSIEGIIKKYDDDKLVEYRNDYLSECVTDDVDTYVEQYCVDMIIDHTNPDSAKSIFIVALGIAVVGIIGLILTIIASKKKKQNEDEVYQ